MSRVHLLNLDGGLRIFATTWFSQTSVHANTTPKLPSPIWSPTAPGLRVRHAGLGRPVQVILPQATAPWALHRSLGAGRSPTSGARGRVLAQERAERFDLADAPLIRFALIRLAAERHRLVLTNHHIVMEGWSMPRSRGDL